jgi:hypothetical protein
MNASKLIMLMGIIVSLVAVLMGTIWLPQSHETLEKMAERLGIRESPLWSPPMPDYEITSSKGNSIARILPGFVAALLVLGLTFVIGKGIRKNSRRGLKSLVK